MRGMIPKKHISFSHHLENWVLLHNWRVGSNGRIATRALRRCQSDIDPRKPAHELVGMSLLQISKLAHRCHQCSPGLTYTHTLPPVCGQLPVHVLNDIKTEPLQTASDHAPKASLTAELGAHKWVFSTSLGKANERSKWGKAGGCLNLAWLCWIERRIATLRIASTRNVEQA